MIDKNNKSDQLLATPYQVNDMQLHPSKMDNPNWTPYGGYGSYGAEDQINLLNLWKKVYKHKLLILSFVTVVTTLVAIGVFSIKPWYRATTILEVGKENSMVLKSGDVVLNDDSDPYYLVNINTKKLALGSYELFEDVVIDQRLDQNPKVMAEVQKKPFLAIFESSEKQPVAEPGINPVNPRDKNFKQRDVSPAPAVTNAKLAPYVEYLRNHSDVEQLKESRALQVTFTNEDPQIAASVTNSIAKIFMQRSFANQTERFNNSADWLDSSTRQLKAKVEGAETALADYTRSKQIYSTDLGNDNQKNPTLTTAKLTQLHDQFIRTQTDRMLKQSLYTQLQQGRIAELPEVFSDPKIVEAQKQLNQLVTQAAELKARYGPTNPKIIEIQNQVEALTAQITSSRNALESKLKADYERTLQDEQSLQTALDKAKEDAVNENQASIKLNILQQDVETARGLYTDFLQKTNQAKTQVAEQNNNIKIIQSAQVPLSPVGPKRGVMILLGFLMSLGTAVGLAFVLEYLDQTVKSIEDVELYAQLPVLGLIPKSSSAATSTGGWLSNKGKNQSLSLLKMDGTGEEKKANTTQLNLLKSLENHSLIGEAYRTLRTSILMSFAGSPPKTILVTSGMAGEGKTTTAINTAVSLTQLGAKVLIMDCDLRLPSILRRLALAPGNGLSTYLSSNVELNDLIQATDIPNLSVLPSGQIPPNPAELISSNKMREMLKTLSESYDHIVIDSPPLVNVTDSVILSGLVDGTIMVVHSGKTVRDILQRCRQGLLNVNSKILGVVLNNVKLDQDEEYRYSNYGSISA